jgi:hypothetical protein
LEQDFPGPILVEVGANAEYVFGAPDDGDLTSLREKLVNVNGGTVEWLLLG